MKKILLTTVAVVTLAAATDVLAMEAGKMYMRGDVGYQISNFKNAFLSSTGAKRLKGFAGDVGFGYALSDSVRTDVTLNFSNGTGKNSVTSLSSNIVYKANTAADTITLASTKATSVSMTEKGIGLMANAYYDFHNSSEFTPYVMLGLGVNNGKKELKFSGKDSSDVEKSFTIKSKGKTSLAYQLGVGVGYEMSKDIHLDLAYKLVGHGSKYKYKLAEGGTYNGSNTFDTNVFNAATGTKTNIVNQTVTLGVRFAF